MKQRFTDDQKKAMLKQLIFTPCAHCGGAHETACPRVKTLAFSPDGKTIVGVEFWPRRRWDPWPRRWPWQRAPRNGIIYLSDVYEDGDDLPELTEEERVAMTGMNPLMMMFSQWTARNAREQAQR